MVQVLGHLVEVAIAVTAVLNIRRRRRREEVSFILRGNWSLPTLHMGHTPYGVIPISAVGPLPPRLCRPPTSEMGFLSHFGGGFASAAPPHPTHH